MNLQALEWLIKSIVSSFICDSCNKKVKISDVNIKILEWSLAILEVNCSSCAKKSLIRSEVMSLDITKYLTKEQLSWIKKTIEQKKLAGNITDKEIVSLNNDLRKENINVSDLFN